ncbi:MAG: imidazoleglycerol-phosphate dehydratase HisB [Micrococcales bacterium]|nr:imidazoleglycerol-phosphate dehydratase HisB [Micrococcales bacterium]
MKRTAQLQRTTSESQIALELDLDGTGQSHVQTGVPFFDHMLTALSKHSHIDLDVKAKGDTEVDPHHTVEDTAIVLGQALDQALGDKAGINRFGDATVPLDEALAQAVVDISGRGYFAHHGLPAALSHTVIGGHFPTVLAGHVFHSLATNARLCLHLRLLSGLDPHHIVEAQFKALARALRTAVGLDPGSSSVPSTKGRL